MPNTAHAQDALIALMKVQSSGTERAVGRRPQISHKQLKYAM
jgi:hypothetical protein